MNRHLFFIYIWITIFTTPAIASTVLYTEYVDMKPKYMHKNNEYSGYAYDILVELNKRLKPYQISILKKHLEIPFFPRKRLFTYLAYGEIDLFVGISKTRERSKYYQFIEIPSLFTYAVFANKKQVPFRFTGNDSLKNKRIVVVSGGKVVNKFTESPSVSVSKVNTLNQAIKMLAANRVDLIFHEKFALKHLLEKSSLNNLFNLSAPVGQKIQLYIAYNKSIPNDTVQNIKHILDEMYKDGTLQKIIKNYIE